ncbi:MAG: GDSL-type esterase/lipase family protein [Thermoanaerobaculia bacterium]
MKKVLLLGIGSAAGLLVAEAVLQLFSLLVPARMDFLRQARAPISLKDARLGLRPNPDFPDHDAGGYRNASVPPEADVVALGDSHTYGTGVRREENWPHRLAERTGRTVYGISCGGWGPTQSLILFDGALALKPRLVVEAFYTGNDLFDCFDTVYGDHGLPQLATDEPASAQAIRAAERREPLKERYDGLYRLLLEGTPAGAPPPPAFRARSLRSFLREHSKLYQLASVARYRVTRMFRRSGWEAEKEKARQGPAREFYRIFEQGAFRTIFTPVYRTAAMDLEDPRIAEGLRIALEALRSMSERAREAGTELLVLLIPTKELVFRDEAAKAPPAEDYWWVIEKEQIIRTRTMEFLRGRGIPFLDTLPALRESLARGLQPYPESADGHPNPEGHRIIAGVVAAEME